MKLGNCLKVRWRPVDDIDVSRSQLVEAASMKQTRDFCFCLRNGKRTRNDVQPQPEPNGWRPRDMCVQVRCVKQIFGESPDTLHKRSRPTGNRAWNLPHTSLHVREVRGQRGKPYLPFHSNGNETHSALRVRTGKNRKPCQWWAERHNAQSQPLFIFLCWQWDWRREPTYLSNFRACFFGDTLLMGPWWLFPNILSPLSVAKCKFAVFRWKSTPPGFMGRTSAAERCPRKSLRHSLCRRFITHLMQRHFRETRFHFSNSRQLVFQRSPRELSPVLLSPYNCLPSSSFPELPWAEHDLLTCLHSCPCHFALRPHAKPVYLHPLAHIWNTASRT